MDIVDDIMCFGHLDAVEFTSAHFGSGTGSIYLDSVGCSGSESRLIDCSRNSVVTCSNGHLEDAGVRCQGQLSSCVYKHFFCCTRSANS